MLDPVIIAAPKSIMALDEAKRQIKVLHSDEDEFIESLIDVVSARLDGINGDICRALMPQTVQSFHGSGDRDNIGRLALPIGPARTITTIEHYDADNVQQTLTAADFNVYTDDRLNSWIEPNSGVTWPAMFNRPDALTITYEAGFPSRTAIPANIKHAAKIMLTALYQSRGKVSQNDDDPKMYWNLLQNYTLKAA